MADENNKMEEKKIDEKKVEEVEEKVKDESLGISTNDNADKVEKSNEKSGDKKDDADKKSKDISDTKKVEDKKDSKKEEKKSDKKESEKDDKKKESKKDAKTKPKTPKRNEAVVNGRDVHISTKHAVAVCDFIRGKNVDDALNALDEVSKMRHAIRMKGEIPHRKGKMMSGRYPLNAVKEFTRLVKNLRANAINHELELEKFRLFCMSNVAARPQRRFGSRRFKRSHVQLKLVPIEKVKMVKEK